MIRRLGPYFVHTHTSKAGVLGRLAARRAGVPVIVHGVHIVPFENVGRVKRVAYRTAERAVAGKTHAFVDVSAGVRDLCIAAGVGGPDRHHIVRSGFDVAGFRDATPPPEWRELLGLRAQGRRPPVVVMVAAFEPRKRHLELLDRLPALVEAFPDIRVVFVGDGVLRSQVEERISSLGLDRNVVLTGFRRDPERYIALADVCLLTSRREGLPRVVLQYLAAGKPVVATDLPGIREVLSENANSLIVPVNDLDALAQATAHLLGDDADRARLAAGAAATDLSEWDARRMAGKLDEIYGAVLRRRPPASGAAYPRALSPT
jgi:glycosyltransferase involved in cell wall biosynthesis